MTSSSKQLCALSTFISEGSDLTIFNIKTPETLGGFNIKEYSAYTSEEEVIFLPGTHFEVSGVLKAANTVELTQKYELGFA